MGSTKSEINPEKTCSLFHQTDPFCPPSHRRLPGFVGKQKVSPPLSIANRGLGSAWSLHDAENRYMTPSFWARTRFFKGHGDSRCFFPQGGNADCVGCNCACDCGGEEPGAPRFFFSVLRPGGLLHLHLRGLARVSLQPLPQGKMSTPYT